MIKGLKVAMIVWAVVGILFGLGFVLSPEQLCSMFGFENAPTYVPYFLALLGIAYILAGVFVIIASRNPLKHIMWVQLAIVWSLLDAIAAIYFIVRGNVTFSQAGMVPIMDVIFVIAFLALYPWRKAPVG
jgi:energy-converting hydrogenase Eha subunit C